MTPAAVVVPNRNGLRWLPGCLGSIARQTVPAAEVVVVDDASTDGSREHLAEHHPEVRVVALERNAGFAAAANRGLAAVSAPYVALVNTDVELDPDWLARMTAVLDSDPAAAAVASKLVSLRDPGQLDDTGDFLRRDGVAEQRGRFRPDDGTWDRPGEVFSACGAAAFYRRAAVMELGGFDERLFMYLEDVDLGLRLRLAGWRCRYEPVVARHSGGGSLSELRGSWRTWVERNTLLLVAKAFPARWLPLVAYRQLAWLVHAARERRLKAHLQGIAAALPALPAMLRERRKLRRAAKVPIEQVIPRRPVRGPEAGGHPQAGW